MLLLLSGRRLEASPLFGASALAEMNTYLDGLIDSNVNVNSGATFAVQNSMDTNINNDVRISAPVHTNIDLGGARLQVDSVGQGNEIRASFRNTEVFRIGSITTQGPRETITNWDLNFNGQSRESITNGVGNEDNFNVGRQQQQPFGISGASQSRSAILDAADEDLISSLFERSRVGRSR